MKKEPILVSIRVNAALWEYLICVNGGSDILVPDYQSPLWVYVKSRLDTSPKDYKPSPPEMVKGTIRIALPPLHSTWRYKIYNINYRDEIQYNFLFRNYLCEDAQRQVENFLMKGFKKTFRDFMTGAVSCNPSAEIKFAIERFCEVHRIGMDAISYEALRKDWYRYRNRESRGDPSMEVKENF